MSRAWMPMYWGDYLADTHHFTAAQHGSYLLLIGFYWCNGGLPHDENEIRQIAKCDIARWPKLKKVLLRKFTEEVKNGAPVWKHIRIDREIAKSLEKSRINSANAKRKPSEVAGVSPTQSQSHKKDAPNGATFDFGEKALFERGKQVVGQSAGGLIAKLLKAKGGDIALARAAIETASTKQNPREYLGRLLAGDDNPTDWRKAIV